jgi:hypothetical protein
MNSTPAISGRKLALLRLVALSSLAFIASKLLTALNTGKIQANSSRIKFDLSGENLWAGYLFLSVSAGIFILLLLINHSKSKKFSIIAKILGIFWFVSLLLAIWFSDAT